MTPFLQLRLWLRRGPNGERAAAGVAGLIIVGLLTWTALPTGRPSDSLTTAPAGSAAAAPVTPGAATPPSVPGAPVAAVTPAAGPATASAGAASAASQGAAPLAAGGGRAPSGSCAGLTATDQGVTASEIHVGIILVSIQGAVGNSLVGVPSPDDQQKDFTAVIDSVNKAGGVACRKLVATYYQVNPLDPSNQHATCLQLVADKVFAALVVGAFSPVTNRDCIPQNHIPLIDVVPLPRSEADHYRPYLFAYVASWDRIFRDFARAADERKWFKGMAKVGLLEESCIPEFNGQMVAELEAVGIDKAHISEYSYGCPSTVVVPPNEIQQAVLQFKTSGVSHVIDVTTETLTDFSKAAAQQQYRPKYGVPDGGDVAITQNPNNRMDDSVDGALAITTLAYGAENSNVALGPATDRCDKIMTGAGLQPVVKQGVGMGGTTCDLVWVFQAGAQNAPSLTRANLMVGLNRTGKIDLSFPAGPSDFSAPGTTSGGQFWRPDVYVAACGCWKLLDVNWRPGF